MIERSRCVAPNVVPMKADRPLVETTRVLNGSAVSAVMNGTLLWRSSSGCAVRLEDSLTVVDGAIWPQLGVYHGRHALAMMVEWLYI